MTTNTRFFQIFFAALNGKHFLLRNNVQDLLVLTDMHVPTLAHMLNVLQLLVRLMRTFANSLFILFTLHSFATTHSFTE